MTDHAKLRANGYRGVLTRYGFIRLPSAAPAPFTKVFQTHLLESWYGDPEKREEFGCRVAATSSETNH